MLVTSDIVEIKGNVDEIFRYLWDAESWPSITPHVKRIEMLEYAADFQRFKMYVESEGKEYAMETARSRIVNKSISYRQLQPPPLFLKHSGEWRFDEIGGSVRITLTHRVLLNESEAKHALGVSSVPQAEEKVRAILTRNGSLTMFAVKRLIEASDGETKSQPKASGNE